MRTTASTTSLPCCQISHSMQLICLLLLVLKTYAANTDNNNIGDAIPIDGTQPHPVLAWLQSMEGGYVSPKVEFRNGGVFAVDDLDEDEVVLEIPHTALLIAETECETAWTLAEEYRKTKDDNETSEYREYAKYVFEEFAHDELPTAWSVGAVSLLRQLLGGELEPQDFGQLLGKSYRDQCHVDMAEWKSYSDGFRVDLDAALRIVASRGWHNVLVPVYDMINHRNDAATMRDSFHQWHNVDRATHDSKTNEALDMSVEGDFTIVALRAIKKGQQLHNSYNQCHDVTCQGIEWTYLTPQIFNEYGFVEQYPQRWRFDNDHDDRYLAGIAWEVDYDEATGEYSVVWMTRENGNTEDWYDDEDEEDIGDPRDPAVQNVLFSHVRRLQRLEDDFVANVSTLPRDFERRALLQYHTAMVTALEQALVAAKSYNIDPQQVAQEAQEQACAKRLLGMAAAREQSKDSATTIGAASSGSGDTLTENVVAATASGGDTQLHIENTHGDGPDLSAVCPKDIARTYHPLDGQQVDPLNYQFHVSGTGCAFHGYDHYGLVQDDSSSRYSRLHFDHSYNPHDKVWDSCCQINEWLQSCTIFRPHYHELVVHYPASFIDDPKRVLFLGGGDIMIMHEILKYPNLELVLGMELDQQVVRSSYRNTGIQPHMDHPAVHWAFGDATKSLLMIPESWYGTFDLVIVDLQNFVFDTVMVTSELNIMDMAMKMVHPERGIISRNDDFVRRRNMEFARYVLDIELHDVPRLCQQSLTIGSHGVDFLAKRPVNHGIETVFFDPVHRHNSTFWTNYRNHGEQFQLKKAVSNEDESSKEDPEDGDGDSENNDVFANTAHGVLVVLEVENVTMPLGVSSLLRANLQQALIRLGFDFSPSVSESAALKTSAGSLAVLMFGQGYVAARAIREHKYVALDLMLWSDFEKQLEAMKVLVKTVGGDWNATTTTTYSNVASGIYGLGKKSTPKGDQASEEPKECVDTAQTPKDKTETTFEGFPVTEFRSILLKMSSTLLHGKDSLVWVVLCGDTSSDCASLEALNEVEPEGTVVPLRTCASLVINSTNQEDRTRNMVDCERHTRQTLLSVAGRIGGIVLDKTAPHAMGQILQKIVNLASTRHELLGHDFCLLDFARQIWSHSLLELVRTEMVQFNPIFHMEMEFTSTTQGERKLGLGIVSAGDTEFYSHFMDAMDAIKSQTTMHAQVLDSKGGVVSYIPDFRLSKRVTTDDYDLTDSKKQWFSQKPVAHQTVYRFEIKLPLPPLVVGDEVLYNEEEHIWYGVWFSGQVTAVNDDGTYDVTVSNGGQANRVNRRLIRKLNPPSSPTYKFGDRVLLRLVDVDGYDEVWYQASVTGKTADGRYMLQPFSDDYGEFFALPQDLILQMEEPDPTKESKITLKMLQDLLYIALDVVPEGEYEETQGEDEAEITVYRMIGEGCVLAGVWGPGSTLVLTWDGKTRLDVNYFNLGGTKADPYRKELEELFASSIPYLSASTVDEQPRGVGRIVNDQAELDSFWFGQLDDYRVFVAAGRPFEFKPSLESKDE